MSNYKKVGLGNIAYVKYAETAEGQVVAEGIYTGTKQGTYGPQHYIRKESGDTVVLNSSGKLDNLLANYTQAGDQIRVTYLGKVEISKGKFKGKHAHDFDLEVDATRSNPSLALSNSEEEVSDEAEAEAATHEEAEEEASAPAATSPTETPATAGKKMTQAELLAKYRKRA